MSDAICSNFFSKSTIFCKIPGIQLLFSFFENIISNTLQLSMQKYILLFEKISKILWGLIKTNGMQ